MISIMQKRKKLWEIDNGHHCSVIGTCLTMAELKKISKKIAKGLVINTTDFQLHSSFVNIADTLSADCKILQKHLDRKYKNVLRRFSKAGTDEEIEKLWHDSCDKGTIGGAYWAVMTHPAISEKLTHKIYGQVHMFSHDGVAKLLRYQRNNRELREKISVLEEVLGNERREHKNNEKALNFEIASLQMQLVDARIIVSEHQQLKLALNNENSKRDLTEESKAEKELTDQLAMEKRRAAKDRSVIKKLRHRLAEQVELAAIAERITVKLDRDIKKLEQRIAEKDHEIAALEQTLLLRQENMCSNCGDHNKSSCPGPELCGQTILYVGGMHKMVQHYRKMIEESGGSFLHHDGGVEQARNKLPTLLGRADAVLCPVDCVSHDACRCVKKLCKRQQKPFVMMRSSGLSSLAKGLQDLVQ